MSSRNYIKGIPYFGEDTFNIEKDILNRKVNKVKEYDSLYELISNEKDSKSVVVIDNKYLTYIRDMRFNYRDREVFIPYYSYKIYEIEATKRRDNNEGHLILDNGILKIRYAYKLEKKVIDKVNNSFVIYNFDTDEKYEVSFKNYYDKEEFNIQNLYELYMNSCVSEEDNLILKHTEGYHVITSKIDYKKNREKELRRKYELNDYDNSTVKLNYRDVRNVKIEELMMRFDTFDIGIIPYWRRILDFESELTCILLDNIEPDCSDSEFKNAWNKLGESNHYIKYGDRVKLIIKDYWLYGRDINKLKTWSR